MPLIAVLLVFSLFAVPALAETCKYVDKDGHIIYSNVPLKNARKLACFQPPPPVSTEGPTQSQPSGERAQDGNKTRVDAPTQRKRDDERRQILEEELVREQDALAEARRALSEQESIRSGDERNYQRVQERLKPFQEAVEAHEKNIASIKREMANLK